MCDFEEPVEVAVIDEIQMLADDQRAWAWTAALLGVPALKVFACGSPSAREAVLELVAQTEDTFTEYEFSRLKPLTVETHPIALSQVEPGDALVAFSRKEVLQFAAELRKRNFTVSVIYGALSPEVRRRQAQDFLEGRTQVVVATDAIGMGLNLPIKRIVFTASEKYDGTEVRALTASEVQQIAGRAGRYGLQDAGRVTAFGMHDLRRIRNAMEQKAPQLTGPYAVMPTWSHVSKVLRQTNTEHVGVALEFFDRISFGGVFKKADLSSAIAKGHLFTRGGLSARAVFSLACSPADLENDTDHDLLIAAAKALSTSTCLDMPQSNFNFKAGAVSNAALQNAENYSRELALFAWLGCKFPGLTDLEGLQEERESLAVFINKALLVHNGKFLQKHRKRYAWLSEDD